jgi:hypothetical protein
MDQILTIKTKKMKKLLVILIMATMPILLLAQPGPNPANDEKCVSCIKNEVDLKKGASALGTENVSSGVNSVAAGYQNNATGDYSLATGYQSNSTGEYSIAMGKKASASGIRAIAFGLNSSAAGKSSLAIGPYATTMGDAMLSIAMGSQVTTEAKKSMVFGFGAYNDNLVNYEENSLIIGFNSDTATLYVGPSQGAGTFGKVGIGTSEPTKLLEVNGTFKVNGQSYMTTIDLDGSDIQNIDELKGQNSLKFKGSYSSSTHMTLSADGKLGIGIPAPNEKLEVNGNILQTTGHSLATSQIKAPDESGLSLTDQSGNGIFVDDGGNVGIGTTSTPDYKLEVNGDISLNGSIMGLQDGTAGKLKIFANTANDNGSSISLYGNNHSSLPGQIKLMAGLNGNIWFETNNQLRMLVTEDGKVGIGTSTPTVARLDIQETVSNNYALHLFHTNDNGGNGLLIESNGGSNDDVLLKIIADKNESVGPPRDVLYVDGTGKIGIGTTNLQSGYILTINGKVYSEDIKVVEDVGADFVFADNYKLSKLEDVEEFIDKNKHLPEIPSADEMKNNGLEIGDMQIKLLQKVEELTLYVIEQQKALEAQQKEIEKLKEKTK